MPRYSLNAFGRKIPLADTSDPLSKQVGRRLQGQPDTKIDSGGSVNSFTFDGQEISSSELREIREIRESGGVISALMRSKALLTFGAGVSFEVEENEATVQEVNGRELTLEEYLRDRLNDIDSLVLELGEDALYYPYSVAEPLENRRGGFGGITGVEPYTVIPETDEYGDIIRWIQTTENGEQDIFAPDELVHFPLNKSSARDKTGISSILRSREEIEQFRANQQAIKSAIELHGFPQRHVKVGREGSAPIRDNELRRVRNLFDSQTVDSDTVFVTGNDVEIDALEAENFEFERVSENDMRQLSLALGVPLELTNYGSDGLGSGKPAEFRLNLFKLQIEANQRQFANIFVRDLLRPVLRDMTPYNHTVNINMEFGDPLQTEKDMATLLQEIGGYMTNAEISERFDLPKPEDEEIAESYRTPAEIEQSEEQEGGGMPGGDGFFSNSRMLDTPEGVPDNAQYLPPGESPPEGATTFPSEGQGSYYVPEGGGTDVDTPPQEQATETEDTVADIVESGNQVQLENHVADKMDVSDVVLPSDLSDEEATRLVSTLSHAGEMGLTDGIEEVRTTRGSGEAFFDPQERALNINPDINESDLEGWDEDGTAAGDDFEWLMLHEIGHAEALDALSIEQLSEYQEQPLSEGPDGEFPVLENMDLAEEEVSEYAVSSVSEFLAETYSGLAQGKEYPDEVMELYEGYGGADTWRQYRGEN